MTCNKNFQYKFLQKFYVKKKVDHVNMNFVGYALVIGLDIRVAINMKKVNQK